LRLSSVGFQSANDNRCNCTVMISFGKRKRSILLWLRNHGYYCLIVLVGIDNKKSKAKLIVLISLLLKLNYYGQWFFSRHSSSIARQAKSSVFFQVSLTCRYISEHELTFTFAICCRPSVCLSSVCLSVCRLSVTFVRPTQAVQIFGNISMAGTLAIVDIH